MDSFNHTDFTCILQPHCTDSYASIDRLTHFSPTPSWCSVIEANDTLSQLEQRFCRDFTCCERRLATLHQLMLHVDDHHHHLTPDPVQQDDHDFLPFVMQSNHIQSDSVPDTLLKQKPVESCLLSRSRLVRRQDPPVTVDPQAVMAVMALSLVVDREQTPSEASFAEEDLPFKCMEEGCHRSYKNRNGLKYHCSKAHHSTVAKYHALNSMSAKQYRCGMEACTNVYTTLGGLKYHVETKHAGDVAGLSLIKARKHTWKKRRPLITPPTTPEMAFSALVNT
jgi:hypothetical protein